MYSLGMTILRHPTEVSVTEATQRGMAGIISDAEAGDIVVTRRDKPVAAVVSIGRIHQIDLMFEDLRDLTLAASRLALDDGARISFDELLSAHDLTRADLDAIE